MGNWTWHVFEQRLAFVSDMLVGFFGFFPNLRVPFWVGETCGCTISENSHISVVAVFVLDSEAHQGQTQGSIISLDHRNGDFSLYRKAENLIFN